MGVHSLMPDLAGSALRTTGEPRRGRCEKRFGADSIVSAATFRPPTTRRRIATSADHAPRRFAPPAAPLLAGALRAIPFSPSALAPSSALPARGPAAPTPRAIRAPCFSLFLLNAQWPSPRGTPRLRPGAPAGDSPVGLTHALRRPLTCHRARFSTVARPHNPACSGLRFATLARR